jgi:hypothetical protein
MLHRCQGKKAAMVEKGATIFFARNASAILRR